MSKEKLERPIETIVMTCSFDLNLTTDEAYEILKVRNSKIAKRIRKYLSDALNECAKRVLTKAKEEKEAKDL